MGSPTSGRSEDKPSAKSVAFRISGGALNSQGQAAGASRGGAWTAVLFNGKVTNLTLGADVSLAFGVNNSGQVVGDETSCSDPCNCFHAFL